MSIGVRVLMYVQLSWFTVLVHRTSLTEQVLKTMADLRAAGADVRRIDVKIRELASWCRDRGRPLDANARAAFVTEKMSQ